jgi:hypothetical protein
VFLFILGQEFYANILREFQLELVVARVNVTFVVVVVVFVAKMHLSIVVAHAYLSAIGQVNECADGRAIVEFFGQSLKLVFFM